MKTCRKCGCEKPLDDYHKHPGAADGHVNNCKVCVRARQAIYREKNLELVRSRNRAQDAKPHRVAAHRAYAQSPSGRAVGKAYRQTLAGKAASIRSAIVWREKNPIKYAAKIIIQNALKAGKITKSPCEICGSTYRIHGHHDDYAFPLTVRWLCPQHHTQWHKENGPGLNGDS